MTPSPAPPIARDYQIEAVAEVTAALLRGEHPIVAAPTGSGKSWIIAERIRQAIVENPKFRAIVVCRTKELAVQNFNTLAVLAPHIRAGFYSAGLKHKQTFSSGFSVIFGTAQSIFKRPALVAAANEVVIDEGDQADDHDTKQYRAIINSSKTYWGLTATPYRLVSGRTTPIAGAGHTYTSIVSDISPKSLAARTPRLFCLCQNIAPASLTLDRKRLRTRGGDFVCDVEASAPEMVDAVVTDTVEALGKIGGSDCSVSPQFMVFTTSIDHAEKLHRAFLEKQIDTALVIGETESAVRADIISRYRADRIQGLVVVGVLTRGFDHRPVRLVVCAFATKSRARWVQCIGRGSRPDPDNPDKTCNYLLDYGQNLETFSSPDMSAAEAIAFDNRPVGEGEGVSGGGFGPPKIQPLPSVLPLGVRVFETELRGIRALLATGKDDQIFAEVHILTVDGYRSVVRLHIDYRNWSDAQLKCQRFLDALYPDGVSDLYPDGIPPVSRISPPRFVKLIEDAPVAGMPIRFERFPDWRDRDELQPVAIDGRAFVDAPRSADTSASSAGAEVSSQVRSPPSASSPPLLPSSPNFAAKYGGA